MTWAKELLKKVWTCDESQFEDGKLVEKGIRERVISLYTLRSEILEANNKLNDNIEIQVELDESMDEDELQLVEESNHWKDLIEALKELKE